MDSDSVIIVGAGGHATVVASTLIALGRSVRGFYADDPPMIGKCILGIPVLGDIDLLRKQGGSRGIIAIGSNKARKRLANELPLDWVSIVHPFSWIHPGVAIGRGTVVCAGSIVQPEVTIASHVIINTKSSVDHHARVGSFCQIATAHLAGEAVVDEGAFVASASVVLPKIRVGRWSVVGAGAVVVHDVAENTVVVGNPAMPISRSRGPAAVGYRSRLIQKSSES